MRRQQEEEQKKLQMKIAMEERRLLLAQRNLESIRLIAELLARAKVPTPEPVLEDKYLQIQSFVTLQRMQPNSRFTHFTNQMSKLFETSLTRAS